ncbi:MAG: tRNA (uridine(34)/cytosine(34)/5-carboxymethylaminomethyluridine(34)-2'-O)-methyltransferase TrmL [Proteobacteria bacterium]|jgi:tRNA (cytidine/uridine-2'-O-)-methyltransferase|nr:tRNA (uridine(34)/cytosine(34)/5-carboxymethylaminomethyluridine(34)-2'-O)-methyltransferase TrmL [Pseudomonadota bacterium]
MFNVVLYEPEIAPNTGNIIRLCANTGTQLHLIEPLGFSPDEKKLRRAGLDYHDWVKVNIHKNYDRFLSGAFSDPSGRIFTVSTHHTTSYSEPSFKPGDIFLFGSETRGLPAKVRNSVPQNQRIRIPMMPNNRSLNLSNSVAITVYEAWRQAGFAGAQ